MSDVLLSPSVDVKGGCDLLDRHGNLIGNIDHILDAQDTEISRDATRPVHGSARFALSEPLDWPRVLLAPSITVTDIASGSETTWRLGTFTPRQPERPFDRRSSLYVDAYDVTDLLTGDLAAGWSFPRGANIGTVIASVLDEHFGGLEYEWAHIEWGLSNSPTWDISEKASWLDVINELLRAAGHVALHADRRGVLTTHPIVPLDQSAPVWRFDTGAGQNRWIHLDSRSEAPPQDIPNRWIGVEEDPERAAAPRVGAGIAIVNNVAGGPTSQIASNRIRAKVHMMTAASQQMLELATLGMAKLDALQALEVQISCDPTPVLWHADTVAVNMPEIDIANEKGVATRWDMKLDGTTMRVVVEMPLFDGAFD